ncbi:MAG: alkene reductase [Bacteriovoracaceae bacterium]|nr:alkene reductase [Bacteriovoracaceae bacterium]
MTTFQEIFKPMQLGAYKVGHRIIMAPLTRCRADKNHNPTDLMTEYYSQRTSAALIVSEATMVMKNCSAFGGTDPGIYSQEQILGWKKITDAVHAKGGKIFMQLWHGGRACHPLLNNGHECVSASAIAIEGDTHTPQGKVPYTVPRALELKEIPQIIEGFKIASKNAKNAGFDGVEVHGANGYLLDQFLRDSSNKRTDSYGGTIANRAKLLLEVTKSVIDVWGADKVGVRLSPLNSFNSMKDSNPLELTAYVCRELSNLNIAYLHMMRADFLGLQNGDVMSVARESFKGILIGNMGFTPSEANTAIQKGLIDAVAFGHHYVSNPDLVERIKNGTTIVEPDQSTYYSQGAAGYTDYPLRNSK